MVFVGSDGGTVVVVGVGKSCQAKTTGSWTLEHQQEILETKTKMAQQRWKNTSAADICTIIEASFPFSGKYTRRLCKLSRSHGWFLFPLLFCAWCHFCFAVVRRMLLRPGIFKSIPRAASPNDYSSLTNPYPPSFRPCIAGSYFPRPPH